MSTAVTSCSAPLVLSRPAAAVRLSRGAAGCPRASAVFYRGAVLPSSRARGTALVVRAAEEAAESQGSDPSKLTTSLPAVLDIDEIMNRLPHRFPFLLVSAVPRRAQARRTCDATRVVCCAEHFSCLRAGGPHRGVCARQVRHWHQERHGARRGGGKSVRDGVH